jgi:1-acyl-sn-glycerol-3-phosphate acyltransferase
VFNAIGAPLSGIPIKTIAKREHRNSWMGQLIDLAQKWPGYRLSAPILFFDRESPEALPALLREFQNDLLREPASLMVHVEGTRARSCRERVSRVGSLLLELAIELQLPIVPVRFARGLPVSPVSDRLEFPYGGGMQDIIIGKAIKPDQIRGLALRERSNMVLAAIEALRSADEEPLQRASGWPDLPPDPKSVLMETLQLARVRGLASEAVLSDQTVFSSTPEDNWLREFRTWLRD